MVECKQNFDDRERNDNSVFAWEKMILSRNEMQMSKTAIIL